MSKEIKMKSVLAREVKVGMRFVIRKRVYEIIRIEEPTAEELGRPLFKDFKWLRFVALPVGIHPTRPKEKTVELINSDINHFDVFDME